MSLDVYLKASGARPALERIFVRRDGQTIEVTRREWDDLYPGREPVILNAGPTCYVYEANITHNMGQMARECGLYDVLWCPEEIGATRAHHLIELLHDGLTRLTDERERLQEFNPPNGWGDYDLLVRFTRGYLAACEEWPEAEVEVSR